MTIAIVIPARYESSRFPGKPLALISGKPMIEWVVQRAKESRLANRIIIACDDDRILGFVKKSLDVEVEMTSTNHTCGTDRIIEVLKRNLDIEYVVNFQGDEPLLPGAYADILIKSILENRNAISTLVTPIIDKKDLDNPNIAKVVLDKNGHAIYFSRSCIPFNRDNKASFTYYKHIGIYGYSREILLKFGELPVSELETMEQLEQLRAIYNGIKIKANIVEKAFQPVDIPSDIKIVESFLANSLR